MIPWWIAAAWAGDAADQAEAARLREELVRLAEKNSWVGVDRTYEALLALRVDVTPAEHLLGGQAALARGDALLGWYRLRRMPEITPSTPADQVSAIETAASDVANLESRFGKVALCVGPGRLPVLVRAEMPFAQLEKDAITAVAQQIREGGCYRGLLPIGRYELDGQAFEVVAGPGWVVQDVGE